MTTHIFDKASEDQLLPSFTNQLKNLIKKNLTESAKRDNYDLMDFYNRTGHDLKVNF